MDTFNLEVTNAQTAVLKQEMAGKAIFKLSQGAAFRATQQYVSHPWVVPLLSAASWLGYDILLVHSPDSLRGAETPVESSILGQVNYSWKLISVVVTYSSGRPLSLRDFIFVLAHEIRHVLHINDGLFPFYYQGQKGMPASPESSHRQECDATDVQAGESEVEYDCDMYAAAYTIHQTRGVSRLFQETLLLDSRKYEHLMPGRSKGNISKKIAAILFASQRFSSLRKVQNFLLSALALA